MNVEHLQTLDVTLPSGAAATVREFTGREEDLLTDEKVLKANKVVQRLLGNLILTLNGSKPTSDAVTDMYSADRFAALLEARRLSYGDDFETEHECSNSDCRAKHQVTADLSQLKLTKIDSFEIEAALPNGQTAILRPLKGSDEEVLLRAREKGELMTELLFRRTISISGIESRQELRTYLRDGPTRIRQALRKALEQTEFGYAQYLPFTCPSCGTEQRVDLVTSRDFFFPGEQTEEA